MSEDKPQAAPGQPPQQSFGDAPEQSPAAQPAASESSHGSATGQESFGAASEPGAPTGGQSFGDAPTPPAAAWEPPDATPADPPAASPPAAPPPAAPVSVPTQPVGQTFGDAPTQAAAPPTQTIGDTGAQPTQTFGDAPAAPPAKRKMLRVVGGIVVGLLLLMLIGAFVAVRVFSGNPTSNVGVGECLANVPPVAEGETREVTGARAVDCADEAATHKVEGRYEDKTAEESQEVCASHPTASFMITTADDSGSRGYVLCLSQITK